MFHYTNLGNQLRTYADYYGYVPEDGDAPEKFTFDDMPIEWGVFVSQAIEATQKAIAALDLKASHDEQA